MLIGTNWGREKEKESGRERWEEGKKERERERERKKRENRTFFKLPSKTRISINIIINCYWIRWLFAPWHWHIKLIILWRPLRYDRWCNERVDETSFFSRFLKRREKSIYAWIAEKEKMIENLCIGKSWKRGRVSKNMTLVSIVTLVSMLDDGAAFNYHGKFGVGWRLC